MVKLKVESLGFSYKSQHVFEDVSFECESGRILALVGPNGAGKTTLLKCINRLHNPTEGSVLIDGVNVKDIPRRDLARKVAYVPQAELVKFPISVFDAIMLGRRPHLEWRETQKDLDAVFEVMCQLNIDDLAAKSLDQMSGGERQKVMLAKAIVQEPEILLLDEPTTFLDMGYQLRIMEEIRKLVDDRGICAILTTHELNHALQYSEEVAILKDGHIMLNGSTELVDADIIRQVYGVDSMIHKLDGKPYVLPLRAVRD